MQAVTKTSINAGILLTIAQTLFRTKSTDVYLLAICFITLIFFVAWFYSIIKDFTMFSSTTCVLMAVGIAVIFTMTGLIAKIIGFLISVFGPIITFIIIFLFFTSSYFLERLIERKMRKSKRFSKGVKYCKR